jgi:hypothetical protein
MPAMPIPENMSASFLEMAVYANTATEGVFWYSILFTIFIISFFYTIQYGISRAFASSLFFITMLALPLRFAGLISDKILFIFGILLAASIVIMYVTDESI